MANLTLAVVESAVSRAPTLGDRLVTLVSLRKRAILEKQTALNEWNAGVLTELQCEAAQDASNAVLGLITHHRIGVEALIP